MQDNIKQIVSDILDIPRERITVSMEMQNTPEWDSLRHMQIVLAVEQNFGIGPLSAEEIVAMTRFVNILSIVDSHLGNGSDPS